MESDPIRFISLWQPYASLIAEGIKKYETRSASWNFTKHHGKLAIVSTQKQPICLSAELTEIYRKSNHDPAIGEFIAKYEGKFPQGEIVAIAQSNTWYTIDDAIPSYEGHIQNYDALTKQHYVLIKGMSNLEIACGNWLVGRKAGKLLNVAKIEHPIPFKGGQGMPLISDSAVKETLRVTLNRFITSGKNDLHVISENIRKNQREGLDGLRNID